VVEMATGSAFEKPDTRAGFGEPARLLHNQKTMGSLIPHTVFSRIDPIAHPELIGNISSSNNKTSEHPPPCCLRDFKAQSTNAGRKDFISLKRYEKAQNVVFTPEKLIGLMQ
jgi:hypothetical protein